MLKPDFVTWENIIKVIIPKLSKYSIYSQIIDLGDYGVQWLVSLLSIERMLPGWLAQIACPGYL